MKFEMRLDEAIAIDLAFKDAPAGTLTAEAQAVVAHARSVIAKQAQEAFERHCNKRLWCIHSDATLCTYPDCECQPREPHQASVGGGNMECECCGEEIPPLCTGCPCCGLERPSSAETQAAVERERLVKEGAFVHDGRIMLVRSEDAETKMPTVHELISEAVAAERERCAKKADGMRWGACDRMSRSDLVAYHGDVGAAIRRGE